MEKSDLELAQIASPRVVRDKEDVPLFRSSMPELDAVRGIAILMVLFYHGLFWSHDLGKAHGLARYILLFTKPGWLGVELFFVLSGFLITGILLKAKGRPHYYKNFYLRRVLRIMPAYFALVLILKLLGMAHWSFILVCALFLGNLSGLLGVPMDYGPLWSLGVEEQYYLLWPTAVRYLDKKRLSILCVAICLADPLLRFVSFECGLKEGLYFYTWFVLDGLIMGSMMALWLNQGNVPRKAVRNWAFLLTGFGAITLAAGAPFGILTRNRPLGAAFQYTPWCIIFSGFILAVLLVGTSRYASWVTARPLRFFGEISYGLYLVHMLAFSLVDKLLVDIWPGFPVIRQELWPMLLSFTLASLLAIALSTLSRYTFEQWFLNLKARLAPSGEREVQMPRLPTDTEFRMGEVEPQPLSEAAVVASPTDRN